MSTEQPSAEQIPTPGNSGRTAAEPPAALSVANRYGAPKPGTSRRRKIILAGSALLVAIGAVGVFAATSGNPAVSSKDVGFSFSDASHGTIDFEVTKDPRATAQCAVQALNQEYAVVGFKTVTIGPNGADQGTDSGRTTAHRVRLRVESPAVSGGVSACWIAETAK